MDWYVKTCLKIFADHFTVIILIAAEILVAGINIVVDLYAGID